MPLGTATIKARGDRVDHKVIRLSFLGDDGYPAGGTPNFNAYVRAAIKAAADAASDKNVRGLEQVSVIEVVSGNCGAYQASYDIDDDKLYVQNMSDGAEATPGDLSSTTFNVTAITK